jgi:cystathionine beta-synthase
LQGLIGVAPGDRLTRAIALMRKHKISQLPVLDGDRLVGSINESSVMKVLHDGPDLDNQDISVFMGKPLPALDAGTDVAEAYRLLLSGVPGIVIMRDGGAVGLITRADLIDRWLAERGGRSSSGETAYEI